MLLGRSGSSLPMSYVVMIVLAAVGGGVMFLFLGFISSPAEAAALDRTCHDSVWARAELAPTILDTKMHLSPLSCKTQEEKVTGGREQIKERMARMMSQCWWMFNEGRHDEIFEAAKLQRIFWDSSENSCFMCYVAPIDQDNIVGGPIEPQEMFHYMAITPHYKYKDRTYLDYIQSYGGPGQLAVLDQIDAKHAMGIVYLSKNTDRGSKNWWVPAATALVSAAGVVACVIAEPCGIVAIAGAVAGGAATGFTGAEAAHKEFFSSAERDTSMIVLDSLKGIEAGECDIKGLS